MRVGGEDWVLKHCCRSTAGKPFLLREAIKAGKPEATTPAGSVFSCKTLDGVDAQKLLYFGTSIFWRAAQKSWNVIGKTMQPLRFGPFDDRLRLFLLGKGSFPQKAAFNVWVSDLPEPWLTFSFPISVERNQYWMCSTASALSSPLAIISRTSAQETPSQLTANRYCYRGMSSKRCERAWSKRLEKAGPIKLSQKSSVISADVPHNSNTQLDVRARAWMVESLTDLIETRNHKNREVESVDLSQQISRDGEPFRIERFSANGFACPTVPIGCVVLIAFLAM
jgi:hypothetical protein